MTIHDAPAAVDDDVVGDDAVTGDGPAGTAPSWYRPGLVVVAIGALAVRLLNVLVWRPTCAPDLYEVARGTAAMAAPGSQGQCFNVWGDTAYSYLQGRLIADGHWFVNSMNFLTSHGTALDPSSGDPPLFALYLAALARLGINSAAGMRFVTAFVGVAGVVGLALLARRLAGPRAALIAGAIGALYPMLWINDGMLLSESLYVPLVILALHAAYTFWERPDLRTAALLGAALGLAALVRAEAVLLLVVLPVPLLLGLRRAAVTDGRRLLGLGLTIVAVGGALVAPWLAFNLTRFERPALMTAMTGAVLSSGSCDQTFYGEVIGYYANCFEEQGGARPGEVDRPDDDETERDRYRMDYAFDYMSNHLSRLPLVMAARIGRTWDLYTPELGSEVEPLGQNVRLNWQLEGRGQRASQTGLLLFWAMLPLAGVGAVRLWRERIPLSPLVSIVVVITVTAAVTIGVTRYRVPLDVVVVVLAAAGIDGLLHGRGRTTLTRLRPARAAEVVA